MWSDTNSLCLLNALCYEFWVGTLGMSWGVLTCLPSPPKLQMPAFTEEAAGAAHTSFLPATQDQVTGQAFPLSLKLFFLLLRAEEAVHKDFPQQRRPAVLTGTLSVPILTSLILCAFAQLCNAVPSSCTESGNGSSCNHSTSRVLCLDSCSLSSPPSSPAPFYQIRTCLCMVWYKC